jgi:hypothetical protein
MAIALTGRLFLKTAGFGTAILASPNHGFGKFESFKTRYQV